jgi:NodT family efflux transporter outer membrane factor (OMF) lipoprotein
MTCPARIAALAITMAALLGGCAVGPNFHRPTPPVAATYRPGDDAAGGLALDHDTAIADTWWHALGSPALDALVDHGLANSPDVAAAQARLRSAQAQLRAGYGAFFPQVDASADATRERYSPSRLGATGPAEVFSLFTPGVAVSYVIDLFGANRRLVEGLRATATAQAQTVRATRLTLAGNIATTAIARAAFHEQVAAWRAIVAADEDQLTAAQARTRAGTQAYASELALAQTLESARAGLKAAQTRAGQADDLLAVLLGDPPANAHLPDIPLAALHLPDRLPLRVPSELVRQRPDILIAEASAHAASAQIGVATTAMLPQITLSAGTGSSANSLNTVFGTGTGVWNYGAGITTPLFAGGSLINKRNAARADYQAAMEMWRQTVITAFGQVADVLTATAGDSASDDAQARAAQDAETMFHLAEADRKAGLISESDLAATRTQWQTAQITALGARAAHLQDVAALYVALGGGI